jgi:uncharacterized protein YkwD
MALRFNTTIRRLVVAGAITATATSISVLSGSALAGAEPVAADGGQITCAPVICGRIDLIKVLRPPYYRDIIRRWPPFVILPATDPCSDGDVVPVDAATAARAEAATFCLTNVERRNNGLPDLAFNGSLQNAARAHSVDMAAHDYFSHTGQNGSTPRSRANAAGYNGSWIGENIHWGSNGDVSSDPDTWWESTPRDTVASWMASEGHRANILRPEFTLMAVGVAVGTPDAQYPSGATYTQMFGSA